METVKTPSIRIKKILIDEMEVSLFVEESVDIPFIADVEGEEEKMYASFYVGKELRLSFDNIKKKLDPKTEEAILHDLRNNKVFEVEREKARLFIHMQMHPKPKLNVDIVSHESMANGNIVLTFRFSGVKVSDNTGTVMFWGGNFEKYYLTQDMDSPYLGFQQDVVNVLREKMRLVFLLAAGGREE